MRETVLHLIENQNEKWYKGKSVVPKHRIFNKTKLCLKERIYSRISSGDKFCSLEVSPPKSWLETRLLLRSIHSLQDICNPLFIAVTWHLGLSSHTSKSPLHDEPRAMRLASIMENADSVVLHLSSVCLTRRHVSLLLHRAKDIGIRNIFALRGDRPENMSGIEVSSDFPYATDLVSYIRENFGNFFTICVAGYPLGHPDATSFQEDLVHLKEKVDSGADFIITQFFFEVDCFCNFVQQCRRIGITVPIIPGVMLIQVEVPREVMDFIKPIKDNQEAVRNFGVFHAVKMVSHIFLNNLSHGVHFFTLNRQLSVIETCKYLGLCLPEPSRSLVCHCNTEAVEKK